MKLTSFFIKNPVASIILNAMIVIIGVMCFSSLSLREYPKVNTSVVTVRTIYPNASPDLVESSITNHLEEKLAGIEGIEAMRSWSSSGLSEIELKFGIDVSIDKAVSYIRDAVSLARDKLPKDAREPTITRSGRTHSIPFMAIAVESSTMEFSELTHFANTNIKNALKSINGVAAVGAWGKEYTYDIILDPKKLYAWGINVSEIYDTIRINNLAMPVGKYRNVTPATLGSELKTIEDFERLIIKNQNFSNPKKKQYSVLLKDVAEIKQGVNDDKRVHVNGSPGVAIGVDLAADANPVEVSNLVNKEVENLNKAMPEGIKIKTFLDQATFIRASLKNIQSATVEAIFLVLAIVFLFLRNIRATIIPIITIPISLVGSILFLKMCGFSINTMTLLAMVLAIGLVVDDAIIVLENISRHIENGISKLEAALRGSKEIGKAVVAMTLTLVSVYAPFAFIQGSIGQLFIEFAIALAGSVLISGVVALTLSPLMCSVVLEKNEKHIWPIIDTIIDNMTKKYGMLLEKLLHNKKFPISIACISIILTIIFFAILPNETAPKEDRGLIGCMIPATANKDISFSEEQATKVEKIVGTMKEVSCYLTFATNDKSFLILPLIEKSKRSKSANDLVHEIFPKVMFFPSQDVYPWSWDSNLPGLSDDVSGGGVKLAISTTDSYQTLYKNLEKVKEILSKDKTFVNPRHDLNINSLNYKIDIDNHIASKLGINNFQIARAIEVFFSDNSNLEFQKDGVTYNIVLKGISRPWDLSEIYVTNPAGKRISLAAFAKMKETTEPKEMNHYNQMKSAEITIDLNKGDNIASVLEKLTKVLHENLPSYYKIEPLGAAKYIESSSNTMLLLFIMSLVFIFAILSLQFNNFLDPLIILITVPLACSGALLTLWLFGISLNIYSQVGLITLIGLITKHGILIVEFINQLVSDSKMTLKEATKQATALRLRPILITTGAMVLGSLPLILSHDSGFEARQSIGYVLVGGLMFGTVFTLFVLPTICCVFKQFIAARKTKDQTVRD